ncbi:hypothetical protein GW796_05370 [archaeon]|nr:hypothetical protein [archaeon]NCT58861.1 hypothetical protein [archaeon]
MEKLNRIFLTGDIHSSISIRKLSNKNWKEGHTLNKNDYVIILGDFGLIWEEYRTKESDFWLKWLDDQPWTTLFIDGNHENHTLLNKLPRKHLFGSKVGIVSHSIFHLLRGEVYNINKKKILTIGGATSHDKEYRVYGKSIWHEEDITHDDISTAKENVKNNLFEVDYVLTHCAPPKIAFKCIDNRNSFYQPDTSENQLDWFFESSRLKYKKHYFGHYHQDNVKDEYENKWECLYHKIIEIK